MIEFCEKARNDQVSPAVMQSTIPLWRGAKGWKSQRLDQKRETIFFLLNDSRLYKRKTQLSCIKKSQIRCDPRHQMQRCWIELLLMVVNESFYTVMHDIPYFPTSGNIWIPYKSYHAVLFIWLCHVCFFFWLSPPARPSLTMSRWKLQGTEITALSKLFNTHWVGLHHSAISFRWSNRD